MDCWICGERTKRREVLLRGGTRSSLGVCVQCDFHFFDFDNSALLRENRLDLTRLKSAGLDIPSRDKDIANGRLQSSDYVREYMDGGDRSKNILEVGCSWGYFLELAKIQGANPFGLEINAVRADYVNTQLKIPCFQSLEECEREKNKFHKIFMFYSLEYIRAPKHYLGRLVDLLEKNGEIVILTPNVKDVLKDVWLNPGFQDFFYNESSIAYYSPQAIQKMLLSIENIGRVSVATRQGYSFMNHVSWYLTQKPRTTGIVGGDGFIENVGVQLRSSQHPLGEKLASMIEQFDQQYRRCIEENNCGNRIVVRVTKK